MGASYTIQKLSATGLKGKASSFSVKLAQAGKDESEDEFADVNLKIVDPSGQNLSFKKSQKTPSKAESDVVFDFTFTPELAGMHVLQFEFLPKGEGKTKKKKKPSKTTKETLIFSTQAKLDKHLADERAEKARKKQQEKEKKEQEKKAREAEAKGGGLFSFEPQIKHASGLKDGTVISVLNSGETECTYSVTINNHPYTLKLSDLKPDKKRVDEIKAKLEAYPTFPEEEARRPNKAWPVAMPLEEVLKGAATMTCPYSLKHVLARGVDPNLELGFGETPLSKVASCGPAKKPAEWKSEFGVSRNWSSKAITPEFSCYRQARESDSVACAIILLQAGAKITPKVRKNIAKESFFAKGVPRTRMLRVFEAHEKGLKIDWNKHFQTLDDLEAPWPPQEQTKPQQQQQPQQQRQQQETQSQKTKPEGQTVKTEAKKPKNKQQHTNAVLQSIMEKKKAELEPTRDQLEALWDHYDADKNGFLDTKECTLLLQDMFTNQKAAMDQEIASNKGNPFEVAMLKQLVKIFENTEKKLTSEEEVKKKLAKMDKNQDNKVDKNEFLSHASKHIFGGEAMEMDDKDLGEEAMGGLLGAMMLGMAGEMIAGGDDDGLLEID